MAITADFIRALIGLSAAELSDETINTLNVLNIVADEALNYPLLTPDQSNYYQGYKAITILGPSLNLSLAEKIKDNFNEFSRFDNLQDLLSLAAAKVAEVENSQATVSIFDIVSPSTDPVTGRG